MRRYFNLLRTQLVVSATLATQYRFDFVLKGAMAVAWLAITLVPILVVFSKRDELRGWSYPEALVVVGWFSLLKAILDGGVTPSLNAVVEGVRTGALDFVLLKPADAQFLVSTTRFEPWRVLDLLGSFGILAYAFIKLGRAPAPGDVAAALLLLLVALMLLYSIWILVVSASFLVVRVDNLSYLFSSLFDVGRWPIAVFRGTALRILFTFVFPVALMTTAPAEALLGRLSPGGLAVAVIGGIAFSAVARLAWLRAIRFYTSASS